MLTFNQVRMRCLTWKIRELQLDPFGYCQAKCWFCPVAYKPNPKEGKQHMSVEVLENLIVQLLEEKEKKDGVVHERFNGMYTAHYNEVLLYKHLVSFFELLQKHKLSVMILSNGLSLTKEKTDMLLKYRHVVSGLCLNIPVFEKELWSKRVGVSEDKFEGLMENVKYAYHKLNDMRIRGAFSIQINGVNSNSLHQRGGWVELPENAPPMDLDIHKGELATQFKLAKTLFPEMNIFTASSLVDRAGELHQVGVLSNRKSIQHILQKKYVAGCSNGGEVGGRPFGWLHVNANADTFLCCNDYDFSHVFGNLKENSLREIWLSDRRIETIQKAFKTICTNCAASMWT